MCLHTYAGYGFLNAMKPHDVATQGTKITGLIIEVALLQGCATQCLGSTKHGHYNEVFLL